MGRVLWHTTMSLDGYIASVDGSMDWAFGHGSAGSLGTEAMARTGAIVAGRRGFDQGSPADDPQRAAYGGHWSGPIFVLTHRAAPPAEGITFLDTDIGSAVAIARQAAGGKDVGLFGADIARQAVQAGLLDDLIVHVVPVLLGEGVRMLDAPGLSPLTLRRTNGEQVLNLSFAASR